MGSRTLARCLLAIVAGAAWLTGAGCRHTQPMISRQSLSGTVNGAVGVEYVFDLKQFDYADIVREEMRLSGCFPDVIRTYDLADRRCGIVIRGNVSFFKVETHNAFYYASIYGLLLPVLTGIPSRHIEGEALLRVEAYRGGVLQKTYEYRDAFWGEWSVYPWPQPALSDEVRQLTRLVIRDLVMDFGNGGGRR